MAVGDKDKYTALSINYDFIVITLKFVGPLATKTSAFLRKLGRRLTIAPEDHRETAFLFHTHMRARLRLRARTHTHK